MFNWKRQPNVQSTLSNFKQEFENLHREMKFIHEELEKVDIKAMEGLRSYRAKLKRLTGDEKETETNKNPNVFLSPNGTFI